jgi:hypothetical protein
MHKLVLSGGLWPAPIANYGQVSGSCLRAKACPHAYLINFFGVSKFAKVKHKCGNP